MKIDLDKVVLQNILQHATIGVHVINNKKETTIYNKTMSDLEGLKRDQVIGEHLLKIFPSLDEKSSTLIKVLNTGKSIIGSTQTYLNFKGQKITTINSTIPLYIDDNIVGALEIANNITHIKSLSDQLIELQNQLNFNKSKVKNKKQEIKKYGFDDIIGDDKNLDLAKKIGLRASESSSSVLIYGDTGTGKELFAQSIHYHGIRKDMPFIAQNCAAIPETLLEGILFGTDEGGFTGAIKREGIFEQANGGTLMLDEINSMSMNLQAKLLRVLQEGYIRRVGGTKDIPVDVRVIATTNENPMESIKKGILRKDIFYRLNVISINIPPLSERKGDILTLSNYFIKKYNPILNKNIESISEEVLRLFFEYEWPGNVRELENAIEGAMNIATDSDVFLEKEDFITSMHIVKSKPIGGISTYIKEGESLPILLEDIERNIIFNHLEKNNNNISQTAMDLGIKRQTLQHKLKKYKQ